MNTFNDLKFIPYGIISVAGENTMKNITMQQNKFIEEMVIVKIQGLNNEKEDRVPELFSKALDFIEMERIRKYK